MQRGDRVGGRFEIVERIASGGMGTVFRAREIHSKHDVAVKLAAAATPDEAARFAREAHILASFADPGVVGYIAHGDGYLVMEWVNGETLLQRQNRAPLSAPEIIAVARQLARALAALHAAGIVHRDVKPANLMLAGDHVKLVDFGIARSALGPRLTRTGTQIGTAGYMAPEQARGERDITGSADMFALGCVLYECLAGIPAFRGDSAMALRAKVLLDDPPHLRALAGGLPEALDDLVMRLLSRDAARRPKADEVHATLAAIWVDAPAPARRDAGDIATVASRCPASPTFVVLVASADAWATGELAGLAEPFTGGAAAMRPDAGAAVDLALELAARLPDAAIAIARGDSASDAIDRGAQLSEQLAIAAATGEHVAGAWIDGDVAGAQGGGVAVERRGSRIRLRGRA